MYPFLSSYIYTHTYIFVCISISLSLSLSLSVSLSLSLSLLTGPWLLPMQTSERGCAALLEPELEELAYLEAVKRKVRPPCCAAFNRP